MRCGRNILLAISIAIAGCSDSTGPGGLPGTRTETFDWQGQLAPGSTVELKNLNGDVRVAPSADGTTRVRAHLKGTRDDPSSVRMEVVETAVGVTICSVYPDVPGLPANDCQPGLAGQLSSRDNDVSVTIDIELAAGSGFAGGTIAGAVEAVGLTGDVSVRTTAGDIRISTSGIAEATSIGGDITASIGRPAWDRDLAFVSVNGDLTVRVPAHTNAEVWGSTQGGSISTDFPLQITRVGAVRLLRGTLGGGGRALRLTTGGGDIALKSR